MLKEEIEKKKPKNDKKSDSQLTQCFRMKL
jgi:hypothetical protein